MSVIATILKIFSYLFHFALSLLLIAISVVAVMSATHNLKLGMLPWTGRALTSWLFGLGLIGLFSVVSAVIGRFRILFLAWTVFVVIMLVRGFFFTGYGFDGPSDFTRTLYLLAAAFAAMLGGIAQVRSKRKFKSLR